MDEKEAEAPPVMGTIFLVNNIDLHELEQRMECERWCTYMYCIGRIDKLNEKMKILIASTYT